MEVWGREEACAMKDEAEFAFFIANTTPSRECAIHGDSGVESQFNAAPYVGRSSGML